MVNYNKCISSESGNIANIDVSNSNHRICSFFESLNLVLNVHDVEDRLLDAGSYFELHFINQANPDDIIIHNDNPMIKWQVHTTGSDNIFYLTVVEIETSF